MTAQNNATVAHTTNQIFATFNRGAVNDFTRSLLDSNSFIYTKPICKSFVRINGSSDIEKVERLHYVMAAVISVTDKEVREEQDVRRDYNKNRQVITKGKDKGRKEEMKSTNGRACANFITKDKITRHVSEEGIDYDSVSEQFPYYVAVTNYKTSDGSDYGQKSLVFFPSTNRMQTKDQCLELKKFFDSMKAKNQKFESEALTAILFLYANFAVPMDQVTISGKMSNLEAGVITPYDITSKAKKNSRYLISTVSYKPSKKEDKNDTGIGFVPKVHKKPSKDNSVRISLSATKYAFEVLEKSLLITGASDEIEKENSSSYGFFNIMKFNGAALNSKKKFKNVIRQTKASKKSESDDASPRKSINTQILKIEKDDDGKEIIFPADHDENYYGCAHFVVNNIIYNLRESSYFKKFSDLGIKIDAGHEEVFLSFNDAAPMNYEAIFDKEEKEGVIFVAYDHKHLKEYAVNNKLDMFDLNTALSKSNNGEALPDYDKLLKVMTTKTKKKKKEDVDGLIEAPVRSYGLANCIRATIEKNFIDNGINPKKVNYRVVMKPVTHNDGSVDALIEDAEKESASILFIHLCDQEKLCKNKGGYVFHNEKYKTVIKSPLTAPHSRMSFNEVKLALDMLYQMYNGNNPRKIFQTDNDVDQGQDRIIDSFDTYTQIKAKSYLRLQKSLFRSSKPSKKDRYVPTQGIYIDLSKEVFGARPTGSNKDAEKELKFAYREAFTTGKFNHGVLRSFYELALKKCVLRDYKIPYGYANDEIDKLEICYKDKADIKRLYNCAEKFEFLDMFDYSNGANNYLKENMNMKHEDDVTENEKTFPIFVTSLTAEYSGSAKSEPFMYKVTGGTDNLALCNNYDLNNLTHKTSKGEEYEVSNPEVEDVKQLLKRFDLTDRYNQTSGLLFTLKGKGDFVVHRDSSEDVVLLFNADKKFEEDIKTVLSKPKHEVIAYRKNLVIAEARDTKANHSLSRQTKGADGDVFGITNHYNEDTYYNRKNNKSVTIVFDPSVGGMNANSQFTSTTTFVCYKVEDNGKAIEEDMPECILEFMMNVVNSNLVRISNRSNQSIFVKATRLAAGK